MVMEFLCPKGHKITCNEDRAGKPAKCPKCGIKFYVPDLEDSGTSDSGSWATASAETSNSPGSGASGSGRQQIEFLCPNGHRVWAPITLQGRTGQCPDCGSKFHIPTMADYETDPKDVVSPDDSVVDLELLFGPPNGSQASNPSGLSSPRTNSPNTPPGDKTTAFLLAMAGELPEGATLEIITTDGQTITPSRFAAELCNESRLALATDDETHTVILLPWDSIARVEIRGLKKLPPEFGD